MPENMLLIVLSAVLIVSCQSNAVPSPPHLTNCSAHTHTLESKVKQLDTLTSQAFTWPDVPVTECKLIQFEFPRPEQGEDTVAYRGYFPRLTSATFCAWVKVDQYSSNNGAILSYTTSAGVIPINFVMVKNYVALWVVDGEGKFPVDDPHRLNHICTWFDSERGEIGAFINGVEQQAVAHSGATVEGGGVMYLGQHYHSYGGNPTESFCGTVGNPMIWPRVLSHVEVLRMVGMNQCPVDHAVVMTNDRIEMWGQSSYKIPTQCNVLTA